MTQRPHTSPATRLLRLTRALWHLLCGSVIAVLILPHLADAPRERRIQAWCAQLLRIFNVHMKVSGDIPHSDTRNVLFVANHISWIDIWALKASCPMQLVAKAEIRAWPMVGWLAQQTGTLFIERERRHDTGRVVRDVKQALRQGGSLCFFPEGTTTDGTQLKPFKTSLMQAAIDAEARVWPLAIRYPGADGRPNTAIAYHGNMTMAQSLRAVLKQREILIELEFAAPIPAAGHDRRQLSRQARQAIAALLNLPPH